MNRYIGHSRFLFQLVILLAIPGLWFTGVAEGTQLTEVQGAWTIAGPQFFGSRDSGAFYNPATLTRNGYVFMFTQGGEFTAADSPWSYCSGDNEGLWRSPDTASGLEAHFTPLRRVSPCASTPTVNVHWSATNAYFSTAANMAYLFVERQSVEISTGQQIDSEVWLLEGAFNAGSTDIPTWNSYDLFSPAASLGGLRLTAIAVMPDTTRTINDGYTHELLRGFARFNDGTVQIRFDFSPEYCTAGNTSSSIQLCSKIDLVSGGVWQTVTAGSMNFTPDALIGGFYPGSFITRNGVLELWGTELLTGNGCPCSQNAQSGQFQWYTVAPSTFALSGPGKVFSEIRCMPAEPASYRNNPDVVVLSNGTQYLLSGQNDDSGCNLSNPFVGMDIITTIVQ